MAIAVLVGVFAGVLGVGCWVISQFILSYLSIYSRIANYWYLIPPFFGVIAVMLYSFSALFSSPTAPYAPQPGKRKRKMRPLSVRQGLVDLFESYHFGIY